MDKIQCKGITKDGVQCKNKISKGSYCKIHFDQEKKSRLISFVKTYRYLCAVLATLATLCSIIGGVDLYFKYAPDKKHLNVGVIAFDMPDKLSKSGKQIVAQIGGNKIMFGLRHAIGLDNDFEQIVHIGVQEKLLQKNDCFDFSFDLGNFSEFDIKDIEITFDIRPQFKLTENQKLICENMKYGLDDYRGKTNLKRTVFNYDSFAKVNFSISELSPDIYSLYSFPINIINRDLNSNSSEYIFNVKVTAEDYPLKSYSVKVFFHNVDNFEKFISKVTDLNNEEIEMLLKKRAWYFHLTSMLPYKWTPRWAHDKEFEYLLLYTDEKVEVNSSEGLWKFYPVSKSDRFSFFPK